jgi:hypothetical protein
MSSKNDDPVLAIDMDFDEMTSREIVPHTHNGEVINQRATDGYINATAMCRAAGKEWANYRKNDGTEAFLGALERSLRIRRDLLIQTIGAGPNDQRGTWVHPQIAMNLATWLSPEFAVQVSEWVVNWMMGIARRQDSYADFNALSEDERRLYLRNQVKESNKTLADAAQDSGVQTGQDFNIFQSHGYQGLYGGRSVPEIRRHKGLPHDAKILDHMGSAELAANLFRITQTEQKLRKGAIKSKYGANTAHYEVGRRVREAMIEMSGTAPENLPTAPDVRKIERLLARKSIPAKPAPLALPEPDIQHPVNLSTDLWKYTLLVMAQRPGMEISTADLIAELPSYITVPEQAAGENPSRKDSKFSQLVRNLKSHKTSKTNFIFQGYAEDIQGGFRATDKGLAFVKEYFKDRA